MKNNLARQNELELIKRRDFSLIKRILAGDDDSFARLMTYYKTKVFIFGKSFFKNETDAEDFVQEVFIKVYTHLHSFKGKSQFSTWLMRIAYTTAINSVNRRKEYLPLSDELIIADQMNISPEEQQIRKITKLAIKEAINELPEKYAVCIDMYFSYDIPYAEISEMTGYPLNTIKSHIFRAKKILKDKLEELHAN
ncbi:MAG: sigma-70 family RNA polymerase sigma factor [Treponema sp.]|nr:sigma-70 family RNA polymerase sigma factor [Treponema sp.]